jgi:fumarate reductase subunit C
VVGSQTVEAYSITGHTKAVYSAVYTDPEQFFKFRLTNPSVLFPFVVMLSICLFHDKLFEIVTPKYLALSTCSSTCPCRL